MLCCFVYIYCYIQPFYVLKYFPFHLIENVVCFTIYDNISFYAVQFRCAFSLTNSIFYFLEYPCC